MKLDTLKSTILENALDAILLEMENNQSDSVVIETKNFTIEVQNETDENDNELYLNFIVSSK